MTNERLTDKRALVRIVDDDEDLLQALAFMLKSEGWEVKTYNGSASFFPGQGRYFHPWLRHS